MKMLFLLALALLPTAAFAQQPDSISILTEDWNAYQITQKHVITSLSAVANEFQKTRAELAAVTKERDELKAEIAKIKITGGPGGGGCSGSGEKNDVQSDGKPMPAPAPLPLGKP